MNPSSSSDRSPLVETRALRPDNAIVRVAGKLDPTVKTPRTSSLKGRSGGSTFKDVLSIESRADAINSESKNVVGARADISSGSWNN